MTMTLPSSPAGYDQMMPDTPPMFSSDQPMGMFAKGGRVGTKPVCIRVPREHTERMAKGGLAGEAKKVANAGVHGDTMIIHINRQEYDELLKHWGEPTINPETGMPQFTPFYKQKWFAPVVALAATALMATGVGAPIGATLLGTLGLESLAAGSVLGATGASIAGNAIIGAGAGALTGGTKGALIGGLTGGLGTIGSAALGATGNAVAGTGEGGFSGWYDGITGASTAAAAPSPYSSAPGMPESVGKFGPVIPEGAFTGNVPAASAGSGVLASLAKPSFLIPAALLGASAFAGGSSKPADVNAAQNSGPADLNLTRRLEAVPLNRQRAGMGLIDYYTYGQRPEAVYYGANSLPATATASAPVEQESPTIKAAMGGPLSRYVGGPGTGRSDSIDAKLSDGEYVIDAETVALLGDGSSKAGAKRLDQFRANIRKQKGRELAKGKFSPDAKRPEQYLGAS
jgi:hypothetical protein